jgi:predicted Zn-dependent protease
MLGRRSVLGVVALAAPAVLSAQPAAAAAPDVLVMPDYRIGDAVAAELARIVALATGLSVKPLLATGLDDAPSNADGQMEADAGLALLQPVADRLRRLYDAPEALLVFVTDRDLNAGATTRFLFSRHSFTAKLSIVSLARLVSPGPDGQPDQSLALTRLLKLVLRAVGEQSLKLPRSTDPTSLMFAPLMSVADLDLIDVRIGPTI